MAMPIVAVIALTLAFWGAYWFVRMGGIDHFMDKAVQRKDAARRELSRELEQTAPLRAIDDPRDAAVILMLLVPRGGDPTREQLAIIERAMREVFELDHELTERMAAARFTAARADSFEHAAALLSDLLDKRLSGDEKR